MNLVPVLLPEMILILAAGVLFLLGMSNKPAARKLAPMIALLSLAVVFFMQLNKTPTATESDSLNTTHIFTFGTYIKMLAAGVGMLFVLLSWPTDELAMGNSALNYSTECAEYFGLMLLSITGIFLVAGANDLILLFLGIELASIPTYIMVSISRPIPAAQEAGVKYFFLGAMAAAIMLFGFSYLYGTTGTTTLSEIAALLSKTRTDLPASQTQLTSWQMLAVVMIIAGFCFKLAAVPLHFYAGDVYQGAATPVTALLSFVPKTAGMVALIKILYCIGGPQWGVPAEIGKLIWVLAVLTMTVGNVLGLLQLNIKRVLAYSSVAHTGYMLVGVAAMCGSGGNSAVYIQALQGVLFYLAAYGIMNAAAFGVLMLLPARDNRPASSAETFEDIAGTGRKHVALGLAMATACFSLIGLPLTVGFFGKLYLIRPALDGGNYWLVAITMCNAAISAGYYLRIVSAMFLRTEVAPRDPSFVPPPIVSLPVTLAIALSVAGTILFGTVLPATTMLTNHVAQSTDIEKVEMPTVTTEAQPAAGEATLSKAPAASKLAG
jgi:NADH-quinone oxidoreductase subunit N